MFIWDPSPIAFRLPYLNVDVTWYSVFFHAGLIFVYFPIRNFFVHFAPSREEARTLAYRVTCFVMVGAVVGSRLGHALFYELDYFLANPWSIFNVWEGGLACHGGVIGVIVALFLVQREAASTMPQLTLLRLFDLVAFSIPVTFACIRIGNFWNQEIVGIPTMMPWGVLFAHPADGSAAVSRHPVQLYEAAADLITFGVFIALWRFKFSTLKPGYLTGLFFVLIFASRIVLEYFKAPVTAHEPFYFGLMMGQWLSLPFVAIGVWLIRRAWVRDEVLWV
jgi:phosphatidylglycerol:prolipoprotein diacylglycerol transferase